MPASINPVLLTLDDVRRLKAERDRVADEVAALNSQLSHLDSKVSAIRLLISPEQDAEIFPSETSAGEREKEESTYQQARKWAPHVLPILRSSEFGLTSQQIRDALEGSELEKDVGLYGNALYNALRKMAYKGEIRRLDGHYCLPDQKPPPDASKPNTRSDYENEILNFLEAHPGGAKAALILYHVKNQGRFSVNRSSGYFYKVLSRLIEDDLIEKEGHRYILAPPTGMAQL